VSGYAPANIQTPPEAGERSELNCEAIPRRSLYFPMLENAFIELVDAPTELNKSFYFWLRAGSGRVAQAAFSRA
jgi:hypothetical protein